MSSRSVQTITQRVAITVGLGYLLLVVVPVITVAVLLISAGYQFAGVSLLSVSVMMTVLCSIAIGFVWLLVRSVVSTLNSLLKIQRLRVLRWAEAIEESHWWARLVRPSKRLSFLDYRSSEEKFEDELGRLQTAYVSGALSDIEFERELDSQFGIVPTGHISDESHPFQTTDTQTYAAIQRYADDGERIVR
ncbi:hypothetical protein SAMN05192552_10493 [Natrinema hispanicum]|uniref:Uncharacterized protein n=2 Tax=Natrinema hispanicum TaxID=392421 RepID=A0A1G6XKK9_9EURY|nr:hypothetical protein SAMN05192552_10493 [Natrinema hispanicum]SEU08209.1 hypothetical protein SAMN04488694_1396 [Natrinema hispanicum]